MTRGVLIVGQLPDPHIEAVARELARLGVAPVLFDRVRPAESLVTYRLDDGSAGGELVTASGRVRLEDVGAVWWRVKPFSLAEYGAEPLSPLERFIAREWRSTLGSLSAFTPEATWVNPRAADVLARDKPVQLAAAQRAGLAIPPTCISNDPAAVAGFVAAHEGEAVYKPVTWYVDLPDRFIFTSQVALDEVAHDAEDLTVAPGIFQRRILKAYEVRATLVGEAIFAARIDSQDAPGAEVDWRRRQRAVRYTPWIVPDEMCQRLLMVHRSLGLVYGAYDLIVTPDDRYVFLEVNPVGQWLWLEHLTNLPISRALAELLLAGAAGGPA